jgi:hypothetical protein
MRLSTRFAAAAAVLAAGLFAAPSHVTHAAKWDPIDRAELALTTPSVEKNADAEALLWDVQVSDEAVFGRLQTVYAHHLRIKIYTDRGREAQSRVDLAMDGSGSIENVEGRSVRRDGTFTEIKKSDVFERDLVKSGGFKVRTTSFVLPAVETGGIVEYRWRELHDNHLSQNLRLPLSRDIPVQMVKYRIAPLDANAIDMGMRARPFHANSTLKVGEEHHLTTVSMANVPASVEEPHAPPAWDTRPWMLIYYGSQLSPRAPDQFWLEFSKEVAAGRKKSTEPTPEIERATASLALGDTPLDKKLAALVTFCRTKIARVDVDTATAAERKDFDGNKSPTAALAAGRGTADDVIGLFVAMARAAGLDARLALLPSRDDVPFNGAWMLPQLMKATVVAVRDGDHWRFLDPANDHAPNGHLSWTQELQPALIADEHALVTATTTASPPEWSQRSRMATLHLSGDGTLEGDVTAEYTGHSGMMFKEQEDHLAPAERETKLKGELSGRLPGVELSDVRVDNVADPDKPYANRYHIKVPGFAQRTGSRLFIQPSVFQKGIPPEFPAAGRRYPIFFCCAWKDVDRVRIELPAGYQLESPDAPVPIALEPFGGYQMKLARTPDGRWIEMTREFFFGGGSRLLFPVEGYAPIKRFFDEVAKADGHTLTLRKAAGGGSRP